MARDAISMTGRSALIRGCASPDVIASYASAYITGQVLVVDGGNTIQELR